MEENWRRKRWRQEKNKREEQGLRMKDGKNKKKRKTGGEEQGIGRFRNETKD